MEDERYTCTICLDRFVQPRSTKCGHIFCENCLFTFVFETKKNSVGSYFECPVCRGEIDLPESEVTLQWIMDTFPLDTNIVNNMGTKTESRMEDKLKVNVDEDPVICALCKEKGRECKAIKYCFNCSEAQCKECSEWHNNFKLLKKHEVITLDRNRLTYAEALSDIREKYTKCKKHFQSCVLFCQTHKTFCCLSCVTSEHRLCELLNISENGEKSREKARVVAEMHKNAMKHIEYLLKLREDNTRSFLSNIEEMSNSIRLLKDELFNRLERQFSNVMSQLKEIKNRMQSDNELEKKLNELKEQCEEKTEMLETLLRYNLNEHVFIITQSLQLELAELEEEFVKFDGSVESSLVCLDVSNELRHFEEMLKSNDTVIQVKLKTVPLKHESYKPIEDLVNDFRVQISTPLDVGIFENSLPLFTCIDVYNDNLLLYDKSFSNMYSYNTVVKTGSNFRLDHVYSALHFDKDNILVSKPELFTISLLKLEAGIPSSCIEWKLQVKPFTLCRLGNNAFVVATQEPTGFKFFKIRGTQLIPETHLTRENTGSEMYPAEYFTADTNKCHLIQSCEEQREINCITFEGQQIFRFQNPLLQCPQGVTVDKNGDIFVCNNSYFKPSILVISASGTLLFEIKEGIPRKPISICSDKPKKRFWVTSNYAESSSSVHIFELVKIAQE